MDPEHLVLRIPTSTLQYRGCAPQQRCLQGSLQSGCGCSVRHDADQADVACGIGDSGFPSEHGSHRAWISGLEFIANDISENTSLKIVHTPPGMAVV